MAFCSICESSNASPSLSYTRILRDISKQVKVPKPTLKPGIKEGREG